MSTSILEPEARVAQIAAGQYGLVTSVQLAQAGLSLGAIHRRVRAGSLIRMLPGVYRLAAVPRSWHQRAMAVYLWAGKGCAIGGTAAAALYKLDGCAMPNSITVMTSRSLKPPNALVMVRRPSRFQPRVRRYIDRMEVTTCPRTLVDIAHGAGEAQLELAVEDARRRRLVTLDDLEEELEVLSANHPGRARLRKVLEKLAGTRSTDSALEVRVIRMLRANGYPEPVRQEVLDDQGRFAGRVDMAYPERRLVIEVQSHRWHDGREPMDLDSARHNRHHAMGWVVMKATSKMLSGSARATFLQDLSRVYHRQL